MLPVSEQIKGAVARTASTRGRWLFAITVRNGHRAGVPDRYSGRPGEAGMSRTDILRRQRRLVEPDRRGPRSA